MAVETNGPLGMPLLLAVGAYPRLAASLLPALLLLTATVSLCLILSLHWIWKHRAVARRKKLAVLTGVAEQVLTAGSPGAVYESLADALAEFSGATRVHLYVYDRRTQCLEKVALNDDPEGLPINPESPPPGLAMGAALAFRSRTLFNIPDTRRSAVLMPGFAGPRSVVFVPMMTQGEVLGILEVDHAVGTRHFSTEERAALQHLGNIVAASIKFQEQEDARKQLFRTERLLSVGQLMSGVAGELRPPLENISHAASRLLASEEDPTPLAELRLIAAETAHALEIAARLISFGRSGPAPSKTVELNSLVSSLIRLREREWKSLGLKAQTRVSPAAPLETNGPQSQLEQVLIDILAYAEHSAAESHERELSVATAGNGRRASVEITCSRPEDAADPSVELTTWKAIVAGYGGEIRYSRAGPGVSRLDVDLPLVESRTRSAARERRRPRTPTTLVVEPDAEFRKRLLKDLSTHGHRVVPVGSAEEGIDLAQRVRFDVVMCSPRLPGLNRVEFFERVRELVGVFVLMIDGFEGAEGPWLDPSDGLVLNRFAYDADFDRVLREVDAVLGLERAGAARASNPGAGA